MPMLNAETELERANQVPAPDLERRISAVVRLFRSRTEAAQVAGISTDQLARYEKGSAPSFPPLAKLARAKGVSLDWLATGDGDMLQAASGNVSQSARLDRGTLRLAADVLEKALDAANASTDSAGRAELLIAIYELLEQGAARDAAERVVATMLRAASKAAGVPSKQG